MLLSPRFDPLQYTFPILIQLQLRDHDLTWRDAQRYALPICLLTRHALDVDNVFEPVDRGDFAFAAFAGSAHDLDFVVFADGDGADLGFWVSGNRRWGEPQIRGAYVVFLS